MESHLAELPERCHVVFTALQEQAFGDFQIQRAGGQLGFIEDVLDGGQEVRLVELSRRQVDGHPQLRMASIVPALELPARLTQYPLPDRQDQTGLFSDPDKGAARNRHFLSRLPPAQ